VNLVSVIFAYSRRQTEMLSSHSVSLDAAMSSVESARSTTAKSPRQRARPPSRITRKSEDPRRVTDSDDDDDDDVSVIVAGGRYNSNEESWRCQVILLHEQANIIGFSRKT